MISHPEMEVPEEREIRVLSVDGSNVQAEESDVLINLSDNGRRAAAGIPVNVVNNVREGIAVAREALSFARGELLLGGVRTMAPGGGTPSSEETPVGEGPVIPSGGEIPGGTGGDVNPARGVDESEDKSSVNVSENEGEVRGEKRHRGKEPGKVVYAWISEWGGASGPWFVRRFVLPPNEDEILLSSLFLVMNRGGSPGMEHCVWKPLKIVKGLIPNVHGPRYNDKFAKLTSGDLSNGFHWSCFGCEVATNVVGIKPVDEMSQIDEKWPMDDDGNKKDWWKPCDEYLKEYGGPPPLKGHICLVGGHFAGYRQFMVYKGGLLNVGLALSEKEFVDARATGDLVQVLLLLDVV